MIKKRICGTKDDTINTKKNILKIINENRIEDDWKKIYIGVIFHICSVNYDKTKIQEDVNYTLEMLNKDFNKLNSNFDVGKNVYQEESLKETYNNYISLAKDCNIEFYKMDIKFVLVNSQTSSNISILDNNIKKASPAIEPNRYLNLWISEFSNGLLGYAQFPWELNLSTDTDGVVIASGTFGKTAAYINFDLNKTLTHEVGHWLGLYHTFQETFNYQGGNIDYMEGTPEQEIEEEKKGDLVEDTPPQAIPTYGNPFKQPNTWPSSKPVDQTKTFRHMFMDFMDYSDDISLFMFTKDQAIKIRQMIHIYRPDILKNSPQVVTIPPPVEPVPFTKYSINFESNDDTSWIKNFSFINSNNVDINNKYPFEGIKCLRARYKGIYEFSTEFKGANTATLSLYVKAKNPNTYLWVQPCDSKRWYFAKFPSANNYKQYTFNLPEALSFHNNNIYKIRLGTDGINKSYSYFDKLEIINTTQNNKKIPQSKYLVFE